MSKWMDHPEELVLGKTKDLLRLGKSSEHALVAARMIGQAQHSIDILTRHLDARVFDQQVIIDAIRALVHDRSRAQVRIIVRDSTPMVKNGNRLLQLAQRLTSFIHIHKLPKPYENVNEAVLIVDGTGYIRQPLSDQYEAEACFNNRMQAKNYTDLFEEIWHVSEPDIEIRRLGV
jgi:hypothetical protein